MTDHLDTNKKKNSLYEYHPTNAPSYNVPINPPIRKNEIKAKNKVVIKMISFFVLRVSRTTPAILRHLLSLRQFSSYRSATCLLRNKKNNNNIYSFDMFLFNKAKEKRGNKIG